jgi:hypothetical protein
MFYRNGKLYGKLRLREMIRIKRKSYGIKSKALLKTMVRPRVLIELGFLTRSPHIQDPFPKYVTTFEQNVIVGMYFPILSSRLKPRPN